MAMVKTQIPEGYATIRRSNSRAKKFHQNDAPQQFEMIDMSSINPKSEILYNNHQNDIYDAAEVDDEGVETDAFLRKNNDNSQMNYFGDNKQRTFETFKPRENNVSHSTTTLTSSNDLRQSSDYLPYDLLMSPLKSPQYINQLNAMRNKSTINGNAAVSKQQFPLYSRPESPLKFTKIMHNNRSNSPSADSIDNCSSNSSSTYSPAYRNGQQVTAGTTLLTSDENLMLIDNGFRRPLPKKTTNLSYRKSFSHVQNRAHYLNGENNNSGNYNNRKHNGNLMNNEANSQECINSGNYEKPSISTLTMTTKPLNVVPSVSTSNLYTRHRFATLAHPKEKLRAAAFNTKSTHSLNESHVHFWDPVLDSKIGSQTTLRTKPAIPWWEIACKKEYRQSCPPLKAHVVNAFEKSLSTMTNRLQLLTATTEKKESEVTEMRQTIELLKKQSIQAGLTSAHIESMGVKMNVNGNIEGSLSPSKRSINGSHESGLLQKHYNGNGSMQRQLSTDSVSSINSLSSNCSMQDKKKKKGWLRSSFTKAFTRNAKISKTNQQRLGMNGNLSDSKTSLPQLSTSPQKIPQKMPSNNADLSSKPPISPTKMSNNSRQVTLIENARPFDSIDIECHPIVEDLKKQLREKDMVLTDIRLEALTQASQKETLKEAVKAMRQEMMSLKHNNERLQKIVTTRSLAGSENSLGCPASPCSAGGGDSRRYSFATDSGHSRPPLDLPDNLDETEEEDEIPTPGPAPLSPHLISELSSPTLDRISLSNEILMNAAEEINDCADGKKISIAVFLGQVDIFSKYMEKITECSNEDSHQINDGNNLKVNSTRDYDDELNSSEMIIAHTYISGKTTWQNLDYIVRKTFKDYLNRIDPQTNLGLNTDSITSYHLGDAKRGPEMGFPEFLPCGYIILNVKTLYICLQGVGSLAFETLIPRSIVHRYINLLTEHRRLILCGPRGTGKTHLARKLGEFLVAKANRSSTAESIATFNVDHKSSKELQQYLSHIAEQASMNVSIEELPAVIILDNLHQASELGDVFSCLLSAGSVKKLPYIICTMSQATCNTSNLQLHHNFRWVLTANHIEPVKGFLGRFLRRRLFEMESQSGTTQNQMEKILRWLPTVVQHINSFLESHSSSDVTIGPNLFLECPLDVNESQKWFLDLWNENLSLYMVEAIKEGIQLYGKRGSVWLDPCLYIRETYPWSVTPSTVPNLRSIAAIDVGLLDDADLSNNNREDPLLNMLNQLKEAASWNETQQDDSDCVSLDSNFTHDSSVENN